jgi:hypothetical protein
MTETVTNDPERSEIEDLLPWYATGRISAGDRARVDQALKNDAELRRRLDLAREEMAETIDANERLPAPSPRTLDRLLAGMDAEPRTAPVMEAARRGLVGWLATMLAALSPQKLAYAAVAALALIAVQAAVLTGFVINGGNGRFDTASAPSLVPGSYVMLSFAPDAKVSEITGFFKRYDAAVVDGPRANGFYKVRVGEKTLPRPEFEQLIERMKAERNLVGFVAPAS